MSKVHIYQEYPKMMYHKDYSPKAEEVGVGIVKNQHHLKVVHSKKQEDHLQVTQPGVWKNGINHFEIGKEVAPPVVEKDEYSADGSLPDEDFAEESSPEDEVYEDEEEISEDQEESPKAAKKKKAKK